MKRSVALLAAGTLSLSALVAQADEVTEQVELGLELYEEEAYGAAVTELEFAISDIRERMAASIGETFPDPPEGWSADEAVSGGGAGGGSMLEREYRRDEGEGQLTAKLMIDNPMVQAMSAMFSNPAIIAAQPNMERIRIGRDSAIVKWEAERDRAEVSFMMDGRILMQVKGSGLGSKAPAVELLKSWDLDALRERAAR